MIGENGWPLILVSGGLFVVLCGGCRRHEAESPPPIAVQVATLKREPIVLETRFRATVRERQRDRVVVQGAGHGGRLVASARPGRQAARRS